MTLSQIFFYISISLQLLVLLPSTAHSQQTINIAYLAQEQAETQSLSNLDPFIKNLGEIGAELGVDDNNTTGQFTGQHYALKKFIVPLGADVNEVFAKQIAGKYAFVISMLSPAALIPIAQSPLSASMLIFDAATRDDALRNEQCQRQVLHLLPTRAMRADALGQYLMKKRWTKWFLVSGQTAEDHLFVEALKRAAKRYNMNIVAEKTWEHTFDARRTAQADVAVFSQIDEDYDVLVVADEQGLFGDYLDYRTWVPRPIVGTHGLVATAWHRTHEQWGATQIQNRFKAKAERWMDEKDYAAYLAVRAVGEAVTRTRSMEVQAIKDYLYSDDQLALQGYKGSPLSFRSWDGQLRQPVLLAAPRAMVAVAPIEGFLHPKTELDTLGYDQPETHCQWN